jgi:hypothetical protein
VADIERDDLIESIASELRRPVRFDADFDARVMAALESPVIPLRSESAPRRPWILRPRTISVSPLAGFALAAALVGIIVFGARRWGGEPGKTMIAQGDSASPVSIAPDFVRPVADAPAGDAAERIVPTPFTFVDSTATSVALVGDFNDWDATGTPLKRMANGAWMVTIPLTSGRHEYQFVINGSTWVADPSSPQSVRSAFGGENSVVTVGRGIP